MRKSIFLWFCWLVCGFELFIIADLFIVLQPQPFFVRLLMAFVWVVLFVASGVTYCLYQKERGGVSL